VHVWILSTALRSAPGGMRRHMELHAEGLGRLGARATVFLDEDLVRFPPALGARLPGARTLASLLERNRAERPDVVNVHTIAAPAWIAARAAGLVSSRIVVMSYAADEPDIVLREPRDVLRWARAALPARAAFPRADGIWCVNQQDVEFYVGTYGVPRARVRRFPHAVADSFFEPTNAPARNPKRVLFVGTWIHRKGIDVLASALALAVRQVPDLDVVLAGVQRDERSVLESLSPELAARTRVIEVADDARLAELYRTSSLFLVPSRREGLPITLLEAMASGCPALAAANSGMLDAVEPGVNGWLEVSFDPVKWAERIVEIVRDPGALARASDGARRLAGAYRIDRVTPDVLRWYGELLR